MAFIWAPGCSWLPDILGTEVDDVQHGSWRHCFTALHYLTAKLAHMRVDVDGLVCPLHHPMACDRQTRGAGPPIRRCLVSYLQWGSGTFLWNVKPQGLDIWWSIDCVDTYVAESYMEYVPKSFATMALDIPCTSCGRNNACSWGCCRFGRPLMRCSASGGWHRKSRS
jgi:hypothetical protein